MELLPKLIFNQQTAAPQKVPHWARSLQSPFLPTPLVLRLVHQLPLREFVLSWISCGLITEAKCWSRMWKALYNILIIFYCKLMVHITDTRAQKVVSYTSAHITDTVFAHDQHWEEQSTLSSPQLYRHLQKHRKWITIQQGIRQPVLVRVQPWEEQGTFPALLTFLYAWCVH